MFAVNNDNYLIIDEVIIGYKEILFKEEIIRKWNFEERMTQIWIKWNLRVTNP